MLKNQYRHRKNVVSDGLTKGQLCTSHTPTTLACCLECISTFPSKELRDAYSTSYIVGWWGGRGIFRL